MLNDTITWLLNTNIPAVRYRTKTELLGMEEDPEETFRWIRQKLPDNWYRTKGLWYVYYVNALAECGLDGSGMPSEWFDAAMNRIRDGFSPECESFDFTCESFLLLQALVSLGFGEEPDMQRAFAMLPDDRLPDGGFLCKMRRNKLNYVPKSCYKADYYALRLCSCCRKKGFSLGIEQELMNYFLGRNLLFRRGEPDKLVLGGREGWRNADVFYPFEPMRVGIQNIMETVSSLGYGNTLEAAAGWRYLESAKDHMGRVILAGTMTKSYLPKEKVGKPSAWATLYSLLAYKER